MPDWLMWIAVFFFIVDGIGCAIKHGETESPGYFLAAVFEIIIAMVMVYFIGKSKDL